MFAAYDALRLRAYLEHEPFCGRIQIVNAGPAVCLRFDEVAYFNRVYAAACPDEGRLDEIESLYADAPFGCELVLPAGSSAALERRGWRRSESYVFLEAALEPEGPAPAPPFPIRAPLPEEHEAYLLAYLRAFEAHPSRFGAALRNMRHLFRVPDLHFLAAWDGANPVAIGMWHRSDGHIMLCAGATLPAYRGMGCHSALLRARLEATRGHGKPVLTWAKAGGQSHANMVRLGMRVLAHAEGWTWSR